MTTDGDAEGNSANGDLFSRSLEEHDRERDNAGTVTDDASDSGFDIGERYRRRLGLSELQWVLLVSLALALPYPVFFYLFFTSRLTSLPLLLVTLLYSLMAIYLNYRL